MWWKELSQFSGTIGINLEFGAIICNWNQFLAGVSAFIIAALCC